MNQELIDFIEANEKDILDNFPEFENFIQEIGLENANFDAIHIEGPRRVVGFFQGEDIRYGDEDMTLISFLYVAPAYRGKGFAHSTIKWLQQNVDTGILTFANNRSRNIFKNLGFKKIESLTKMEWKK